jgi:alpha-D-xyloside xylohydrolase
MMIVDRFRIEGGRLCFRYDCETLWIESWGRNSLRIRATKAAEMPTENWALLAQRADDKGKPAITISEIGAQIDHGRISASLTPLGRLTVCRGDGTPILHEYVRNWSDPGSPDASALGIEAREFRPILGGDYRLTMRFESLSDDERIYGMGQYQQPHLDLKGHELELAQRNSQASVPFAVSSLGYGFLWNNPGIGRVTFGRNLTLWQAESTIALDYWITVGDTPAEILHAYAGATGTVPRMPECALGFWQSKLRYRTQEELLSVAREYRRRGLPLSVIVADFFHWPYQGDWRFDPVDWPDPEAMVRELDGLGIALMVSIWPTVDRRSENYTEMVEKGLLIRTDRGLRIGMDFQGNTIHVDPTNPVARDYLWRKAKANYYDKGVALFWLDEAEPEYAVYDFDNYRYHLGPNLRVGNLYPMLYTQAFHDGLRAEGQTEILHLVRCAWAGSQRYGALVWSGDIHSSFESLRNQLVAGLNMGMAGIPWWTTDIGGFQGGDPQDPAFRELLIRWFEWGTFCPVMRLHGDRDPKQPRHGQTEGAACLSGADNEVWSFGPEAYHICREYLFIRERLKPYLRRLMEEAHRNGSPVMRPLFYEFPDDALAWRREDEYLLGSDLLVAPILHRQAMAREVYLPAGAGWMDVWSGETREGGVSVTVDAPLERIPLFIRSGADLDLASMIAAEFGIWSLDEEERWTLSDLVERKVMARTNEEGDNGLTWR